jgi:hypothetical protein
MPRRVPRSPKPNALSPDRRYDLSLLSSSCSFLLVLYFAAHIFILNSVFLQKGTKRSRSAKGREEKGVLTLFLDKTKRRLTRKSFILCVVLSQQDDSPSSEQVAASDDAAPIAKRLRTRRGGLDAEVTHFLQNELVLLCSFVILFRLPMQKAQLLAKLKEKREEVAIETEQSLVQTLRSVDFSVNSRKR